MIILIIVALILLALLIMIIVLSLIYTPKYVARILVWGLGGGGAQITDHLKFLDHKMENALPTFYFKKSLNEELVTSNFNKINLIEDLDQFLKTTKTTAFIVIQNDTILYEKYFNAHTRESIETSFSCAKSFASALVGIAVDEGFIKNVNDPITDYIPELKERDIKFESITVKHLLQMSSGIKYKEAWFIHGDNAKTYYVPDLRRLALEKTKIVGKPMQYFLYNNYHPLLIGIILERATGRSVANYLQDKIWKSLGMEFEGSWSIDSKRSNFEKMESGINARAIDFAKFGKLFLNNGMWGEKQIISEKWVKESTSIDKSLDYDTFYRDLENIDELHAQHFESGKTYYKYFWWGYTREDNKFDFCARGNHGQYIYICPDKNLIIVRHGKDFGIEIGDWPNIFYDFATIF